MLVSKFLVFPLCGPGLQRRAVGSHLAESIVNYCKSGYTNQQVGKIIELLECLKFQKLITS